MNFILIIIKTSVPTSRKTVQVTQGHLINAVCFDKHIKPINTPYGRNSGLSLLSWQVIHVVASALGR